MLEVKHITYRDLYYPKPSKTLTLMLKAMIGCGIAFLFGANYFMFKIILEFINTPL